MKNNDREPSISRRVSDAIRQGDIKMHSRSYFWAKGMLFFGVLVLLVSLILYLGSLLVFVLRANSILVLPGLGLYGLRAILLSFPWFILALTVVLVGILEWTAKRFAVVYRRPLIYSLLIIMVLAVTGSILMENLSFHRFVSGLAKERQLPAVGRMYRHLSDLEMDNVYFGVISEKEVDHWKLKLNDGSEIVLDLENLVQGRRLQDRLAVGSEVVVIGEEVRPDVVSVVRFRRLGDKPDF